MAGLSVATDPPGCSSVVADLHDGSPLVVVPSVPRVATYLGMSFTIFCCHGFFAWLIFHLISNLLSPVADLPVISSARATINRCKRHFVRAYNLSVKRG